MERVRKGHQNKQSRLSSPDSDNIRKMTGMGDISFSQCLILTEKQHAQCMQKMLTEPDRAEGKRRVSYRMRKHEPGKAQWVKELVAQTW